MVVGTVSAAMFQQVFLTSNGVQPSRDDVLDAVSRIVQEYRSLQVDASKKAVCNSRDTVGSRAGTLPEAVCLNAGRACTTCLMEVRGRVAKLADRLYEHHIPEGRSFAQSQHQTPGPGANEPQQTTAEASHTEDRVLGLIRW